MDNLQESEPRRRYGTLAAAALLFLALTGVGLYAFTRTGERMEGSRSSASGEHALASQLQEAHTAALESVQVRAIAYAAVLNEYQSLGSVDARTIGSREEAERRIALLLRVQERYADLMSDFAQLPEDFRTRLAEQDFSPQINAEAERRFEKEYQEMSHGVVEVQDLEMQILRSSEAVLEVLRDEWGNWRADQASGAVVFAKAVSDESFEKYQSAQQSMIRAADEQAEKRRELEPLESTE